MSIIIALVLNALALIITAYVVPGIGVTSFTSALLAAIVLGLINTFIKPLLVFLTAPLNYLTLGLFSFVINAFVLWLVTLFVPGFRVESLLSAILGAIVLSVVSTILAMLLRDVQVGEGRSRSKRKRK